MQTLTEYILKLSPPFGLFDRTVVENLFPEVSDGARKLLIHRAVNSKEILRLKRGLFVLSREYQKILPHPFLVAAMLHSPSHISLESALSFHGLIPEAVFQVSSVTSIRSRSFDSPLGFFTFQRVPMENPRSGVQAVKIGEDSWAFIAEPLRAITDLIYLRKEISWVKDGAGFLIESMRMEEEDLHQINFSHLNETLESLRDKRTVEYLRELKKVFSR